MAKPKAKSSSKGVAAPKVSTVKPRVTKAAGKAAPQRILAKRPADRLERLWLAIQQVRDGQRDSPRTARLIAAGAPKLAQKVVEEAGEVAIEAVLGHREALVNESVDLLYNLVALWNGSGIKLPAIWAEMDRREATLGMAEKLPKTDDV